MNVSLFRTFSHVIIMTGKVDPWAEGGARILIKESSIKAIGMCRVLKKARLILLCRCTTVRNHCFKG